eukprot:8621874-Pyramimonas_sp.AAC.1
MTPCDATDMPYDMIQTQASRNGGVEAGTVTTTQAQSQTRTHWHNHWRMRRQAGIRGKAGNKTDKQTDIGH